MTDRATADRIDALWRQLAAMADMQARRNRLVHPQWERQGHPYYRAVWVECAELLDHYGWKWWKSHQPAIDQAKLEVVDIWHFGLSELVRNRTVERHIARSLVLAWDAPPGDFRTAVERLARASLASFRFDLTAFAGVMRALPLGFDELYRIYVGKNVLNDFRQRHGYRTGGYRKVWDGREDNEHLTELAAVLPASPPTPLGDPDAADFARQLDAALEARYAATRPEFDPCPACGGEGDCQECLGSRIVDSARCDVCTAGECQACGGTGERT